MSDFNLCDVAAQTLEGLDRDGVKYTPQDVLTIQFLSLQASHGEDHSGDLARGRPVELCANEWLYPITIAGSHFYTDLANDSKSDKDQLFILGYALRYGNDVDRIYKRGREALADVRKWARRLPITINRLADVIESIVDAVELPTKSKDPETTAISLSLIASSLVGGSPQMWETICSADAVAYIIDTTVHQKLSVGGSAVNDEKLLALRHLAEYEKMIRERGENVPHD